MVNSNSTNSLNMAYKKNDILYIIGNGFDRHHNLKTSYYHFSIYLKEKNINLYNLLEDYIAYPNTDDDCWYRFEENLASFDIDSLVEENKDYLPDIASDDFRDRDLYVFPDVMSEKLKNLTTDLLEIFEQFILEVETPKSANDNLVELNKEALFFNFNYTPTLEHLYGVNNSNILYIHNKAGSEEIILGHGIDPKNFKEEKEVMPDGLTDEEKEQWYEKQNDNWDYSFDTGREEIYKYFAESYKPTLNIIESNYSFFSSLGNVKSIYVFGHSLSIVDLPYFQKIVESISKETKWIVSFYDFDEKESHLNTLISIGVNESNIEFIELSEIQLNSNQLKLKI